MLESGSRFSREAILLAMNAAGLASPIAQICRARDGKIYYDLVSGAPGERRRERVLVDAEEAEFQRAIDRLSTPPRASQE